MSFVEDLKAYLSKLNGPEGEATPTEPLPISISPEWARSALIQALERLERESLQPVAPTQAEKLLSQWTANNRVVHFATVLAKLLQSSFLKEGSLKEIEFYVRSAIAQSLGLTDPMPSLARGLELKRLSTIAWNSTWDTRLPTPPPSETGWKSFPTYALEIRATRRTTSHIELTPIGKVLLSLTGRDAVLWLLHIEAAQSMGPADDWRLSRETAHTLLEHPHMSDLSAYGENIHFPHSWATMRRLEAFGLLRVFDIDDDFGLPLRSYNLLDEGSRALKTLLSPTDSPFSVLAGTLSQDEALATLDDKMGHSLVEAGLNNSALATARQARLVAHEIRNALIPAQVALTSLYAGFVGSEAEANVARLRPRIDPGLARVLKFVDELLKMSELATRPPEAFELKRAILDAQSSLSTESTIAITGPATLPSVLGYRERFVLAVVNLLRNAEQAGASQINVSMALESDDQNILLTFDDNGPGVPQEHRERIFQRGISFRPGGAGEGLALVREVVEFELRGKVACVEKTGPGARFRMRLPVVGRSSR